MTITPIQYPMYNKSLNFVVPQCVQKCTCPQQTFATVPFAPYDSICNPYPFDPNWQDKIYAPVLHITGTDVQGTENMLYQQNNIEGLLNFGANKQMKDIYPQIKDNPDFKELLGSKYYQNGAGFINLLDTIAYLKFKREENLRPFPVLVDFPHPRPDYSKYDTTDYLIILNNFVKSDKLSDDLKRYYLIRESKNIDSYYNKMDLVPISADPVAPIL